MISIHITSKRGYLFKLSILWYYVFKNMSSSFMITKYLLCACLLINYAISILQN